MSGTGYNGIEALKAAEEEAASIILEARQARQSSMVQAKEKAKEEVDTYRAQLETEFSEKKQNSLGAGSQKEVDELSAETEKQIVALKADYETNHQEMLNLIVKSVLDVHPVISEKKKRKD